MYEVDEEQIIKELLPTVKRIASDLVQHLPKNVEVEDLIQEGVLALISAIRRYDPRRGVNLRTFLIKRIKGAMYDYLRNIDWMPRNLRRNIKEVEKAIYELESKLGRHPTVEEVSLYTNLSNEEVIRAKNEMVRKQFLRLDEYLYDTYDSYSPEVEADSEPLQDAYKQILLEQVTEAIKQLSQREQLVLSLRFEQELSLKEIGLILGVSESRVSQILSSALIKIKKYVLGEDDGKPD
ncbi:RNA polymerase subunit sigma-70 [Thermotoga sp. Ku-13t]|uniref:FliA/WhiG family RNA polymerase sigma factor n=1 Tax=Thermotoga sp. Ku-13t TaxID=1755813 RepID=UPI0013ECABFB|nr:FliA/WhiG family RNA polymerase sigma factor [Thermotoga sp. Ku-13t]KAF2957610.1 RNA polymerase subunit sigma-70 [Thermotoga sp. Ku-13t]